jgi:hypothetical protein
VTNCRANQPCSASDYGNNLAVRFARSPAC